LIPLCIFGVGATIYLYISSTKSQIIQKTLLLTGVATILAVIYFILCNSYNISNYYFANLFSDIDAYAQASPIDQTIHIDTLFHSAIIQMLSKFNASSLGLDGLKPLHYHIAAHRWIASNLNVLNGNAPLLLAISKEVAFVPVLFFAMVVTCLCLAFTEIPTLVACGLIFLALFTLDTKIWNYYLVSESYTFSLPIFMGMLPLGKSWLLKACESNRWVPVHPVSIAMAVVAVMVCGTMKISSGVMLALFLTLCISTPKIWHIKKVNWRFITIFCGIILVFLLVSLTWALIYVKNTSLFIFDPFNFAKTYTDQFIWQNIFFIGLVICF